MATKKSKFSDDLEKEAVGGNFQVVVGVLVVVGVTFGYKKILQMNGSPKICPLRCNSRIPSFKQR